ncbi:MAG: 3-phosphoglycerate dehydrogenase [Bacteroidales bacterium]|jgi:D-3-phosphoglycerate dehydrogenase|nr:3-phosphoglycerate dehydrogenase [Bacteroidales bacterium]HPM19068.1 NAD(P)-dependent oxidoreductase [Bacteroidales bacterium]HQG78383.1 NAD(P)-dependent oxidoreductase [Bacteroidales bacterium]
MKVLVATEKPFAEIAARKIKELIDAAGYEAVFLENYKSASEFASAVSDADALIVRSDIVSAELLDAAKRLKIVVRAGAGYDNLDLEACTRHNVVAMNTPGQNSNAVAELAFEMMLYMARSGFSGKSGTELRGKTIGIHGFGNVGRYVAEISGGFGMTVSAFDPYIAEDVITGYGIRACKSAKELYSECQYISLNIPFNKETGSSVNYSLLSGMPVPAVLVNTARKEIIDEESLLKMFAERPDFRYLSDVAPDCKALIEEKYSGRFLFTAKKMGAQTEEANSNAGIAAINQIVDYFKTGNQKFRLNK